MSLNLYAASVPVFVNALKNLDYFLDKAQTHAEAKKFDTAVLVDYRLAPDMLPFSKQIQIACDAAKLWVARVGGLDAPKFDDSEKTFAELKSRIAATVAWLESVKPTDLDGKAAKEVSFPAGRDKTLTMTGSDYLRFRALPNLYFHTTTAYAILRHNGVELGKTDFLHGRGGV